MKIGVDARNLVSNMTGIGRYVLEMCRHLALRGHDLVLYLPEKAHPGYPAIDGAELRTSHHPGALRRLIWGRTMLPRLAARDGVDVLWGPAHRLPRRLDPAVARVVTIHDLTWRHAPSSMRWRGLLADSLLMRGAVEAADRIAADSTATAEAVAAEFPASRARIRTVYPGLSAIAAGPSGPSPILSRLGVEAPYMLFVGTLEPRKNLKRLLGAYASLPEEIRARLPLVLAGGQGWGFTDPGSIARRLGIERSVRLTGYVDDAELHALYRGARFLAMPSLYEGFGLPIIEANAAGIPVLTSNTSSMPEVAGDAALLVDPLDVSSIAAGLERLACDDNEHARLAARARANASRFDWAKSAEAMESVFEEAILARRSCGNAE